MTNSLATGSFTGWKAIGRSIAGIVFGYITFVLGAWVVQEAILGGVSYYDNLSTLVLAGLLTPISAAIGAIVTIEIAGRRPWLHLIPMFVLITVETTFLYNRGLVDGPLWFEAAAGASLIAGAIVGILIWARIRPRFWTHA